MLRACLAAVVSAMLMGAAQAAAQPNIIVILADDLDIRLGSLPHLKRLKELTSYRGMVFRQSFVSLASCCPSRVSMLRGQYAHETGVFGNWLPDGGWQTFVDRGNHLSNLATWMLAAGYRTGYLGCKFLNGYQVTMPKPPGWNNWAVAQAPECHTNYNYPMRQADRIVQHGSTDTDYLTDVMSRRAQAFIRRFADRPFPFFLMLSPAAPHEPATPSRKYLNTERALKAPRTPAYDEADVSDKPEWLRTAPRLTALKQQHLDLLYRRRIESMRSVEDMIQNIVRVLTEVGQLDNTYIIFTSDNGYHLGQHRLPFGKLTHYDEDIHVPLFIRGPGIRPGSISTEIVANVDLAPTIAELAGATVPDFVSGRSLVPLLFEQTVGTWRQGLLLEAFRGPTEGKVIEYSQPQFVGVRTPLRSYIFYDNGEEEIYDMTLDHHQLRNIASAVRAAEPAMTEAVKNWTLALSACAGAACRALEAMSEPEVLATYGPTP